MRPLDKIRFLGTAMVGAYIVLNALMLVLRPLTRGLPMLGSTAVIVPPMVLAMVYLVIPIARRATQGSASAPAAQAKA